MIRQIFSWRVVVVVLVTFFVVSRPNQAADLGKSIGRGIKDAANGFITFFTALVS